MTGAADPGAVAPGVLDHGKGSGSDSFVRPVAAIIAPLIGVLDERLAGVTGPTDSERAVVSRAARQSLLRATQLRLNRVLLLELHAAALAGRLRATDERQRWAEFVDLAVTEQFRAGLRQRYPTLQDRIDTAGRHFVTAVCTLAGRLAADRDALAGLTGGRLGPLRALRLDAGDPHRGGHTVARLDFAGGTVMYKPRPVQIEAALDGLLAALLPGPGRIRTPRTLARDGYGWTEYVPHRYCRDEAQTALFYRNLGRWLAVMRLVGGVDLHADNIIADGPVPVVVDAETLFAPCPPAPAGRCGAATDTATAIQRRAVLRSGILPMRVGVLSGLDISAVGKLPGQQPQLSAPTIAAAGTDGARLELAPGEIRRSANHPTPDPAPERFWEQIVTGFLELSGRLRRVDAGGGLAGLLRPFLGCEVRQVLRSTRVYGDLRRMLWHPASLHDEPAAVRRARAVLGRHAVAAPGAPADPAALDAEIAELLAGDVPVFGLRVDQDRIDEAVADWRRTDLETEARLIRFALAGAFQDGLPPMPARRPVPAGGPGRAPRPARPNHPDRPDQDRPDQHRPDRPDQHRQDPRRRALAAAGVRELCATAVRGADGTATWLGPVLTEIGWTVRPLPADLYSGLSGVVVCLAGYRHEARAGRADPVDGLDEVLDGALATLRASEDAAGAGHAGGFTGLAGQVWTWCALARLLGQPDLLDRAQARAALLKLRPADRARAQVLGGVAGVIVPMLALAEATGNRAWLAAAAAAGEQLVQTAGTGTAAGTAGDTAAWWPATGFPDGTGGFGYGSAGIGWALARLAGSPAGTAPRRARWQALAERALGLPAVGTLGAGSPGPVVDRPQLRGSWCRGSAGVGLAAGDLYARTGDHRYLQLARQTAGTAVRDGLGWSGTLCHGDAGVWELLDTLRRTDPDGPAAGWLSDVDDYLLGGPARPAEGGAAAVEAGAPSLLTGLAGTVFTLLRMHPRHQLCSPLLLDPQPPAPASCRAARPRSG